MTGIALSLLNVSKEFTAGGQDGSSVLKDVSLQVEAGEFITLVGPNGCGKTTLLNCIAGLLQPDVGQILYDSSFERPRVGYVFQNYAESLFPWLTGYDNVVYPLALAGIQRKERYQRVDALLSKLKLKNLPLTRRPSELSGGQRQMIAILRALIYEAQIMLMDEPFAALDLKAKMEMHEDMQRIWQLSDITILMVSHDVEEAILLGDRVVVLSPRPARILANIKIDQGRPRSELATTTRIFADYKRHVLEIFQKI